MAFIVLKKCLSEPKQLLKLIVLIVCVCLASYQLSECFNKLIHPPISTHYRFKLNESIYYPAVSICRNPGYKDVFSDYGFTSSNIDYSSVWRSFNYSAYNLSDFFEKATYTLDEIVNVSGFYADIQVTDLTWFYTLKYGRCFTFRAMVPSATFSEMGGYKFEFQHTEIVKLRNHFGISLAGYHVYIHDPRDMLREEEHATDQMEYLYLEAGEDMRVNLRVQKYNKINSKDYRCEPSSEYGQSKCEDECVYKQIMDKFNCTTPWMQIDSLGLPECDSYELVRNVMLYHTSAYREKYLQPCDCPLSCNISVYSTYVQSRKEVSMPKSNLSLYFSSNLVTVMDEIIGYDWNTFISDLGGSLGFLLGLSVIGAISLVEQILLMVFFNENCSRKRKEEDGKENVEKEEPPNNASDIKAEKIPNVPTIKVYIDDDSRLLQKKEKNKNSNNSGFILYENGVNVDKKISLNEKF